MKISVVVPIYNEEKLLGALVRSLLGQSLKADEIILVDDGSTDNSKALLHELSGQHDTLKYIFQDNSGPAAARNKGWRKATGDIIIFTDGDCLPERNWIENLVKHFSDEKVGGVGGTYRTLNDGKILARFIGCEISYKYRGISGVIDVHGSYNLAIRRKILEEVGGYNEVYKKPSGEDWDLTYRISKSHKLVFDRSAVVGHYHPEKFWPYMKNQARRGFDRVRIYLEHPGKMGSDSYTGSLVKYQVLFSGALIPSLFLAPFVNYGYLLPLGILGFLIITSLIMFPYLFRSDKFLAFYSIPVQVARNFAWFWGMMHGIAVIMLFEFRKREEDLWHQN
ncbi:MAG: glycosyltransferase [Oligoflexales bacterium]|nr:glycosyltransferase [Oligoflexales bacterium]